MLTEFSLCVCHTWLYKNDRATIQTRGAVCTQQSVLTIFCQMHSVRLERYHGQRHRYSDAEATGQALWQYIEFARSSRNRTIVVCKLLDMGNRVTCLAVVELVVGGLKGLVS